MKKNKVKYFPIMIILASITFQIIGYYFYLLKVSQQTVQDFFNQNYTEIAYGDVLQISKKLNALTKSINWVCVSATNSESVFFEIKKSDCKNTFFKHQYTLQSDSNKNFVIALTLRLPEKLEQASVALLLFQIFALISLFYTSSWYERRLLDGNLKIMDLSTKLAHDIRAPLTVLQLAVSSSDQDFEKNKKMLLQATQRIQNISENLLNFDKNQQSSAPTQLGLSSLSQVVKKMIGEKTLLAIGSKTSFTLYLESKTLFLFAKDKLSDLERILSNLIDNATEVLKKSNSGKVIFVIAKAQSGFVTIKITDNGDGIPAEILPKLCQKGVTFGKANGNGLGLYHAKKTIESWGGEFKIESQVGVGTTVSLTVPIAQAPDCFALQISVSPKTQIAILDDDQFIIQSWQNRFSALEDFQGQIVNFKKIDDFEHWFFKQKLPDDFLFLCDYDLGDLQTFGLDVIEKCNLQSRSILVTGRADNAQIQNRVTTLKTKLLSKDWIEDVEILISSQIHKTHSLAAVLIDDDELIRSLWQNKAKSKNIALVCYESSQDFLDNLTQHSTQTQIYVDSDLKGERGEDFVKHLASKGFASVILTTGYPKARFSDMPWITKVIDKSPPW